MAKKVIRHSSSEETLSQQPARLTLPAFNLSFIKNLQPKSYTPIMVILLIVAAFLIGVLITKVSYLENGTGGTGTPALGTTPQGNTGAAPVPGAKVDVEVGSLPVLGNEDAEITVIEFADFQCPFCKQWHTQVGENLRKDYVDTGKVKFAFRNFAFLGQESNWSAEAAYCANDQDKFWEFHDYLYDNQGGENVGAFSKENLKKFAATLGLNTSAFNSCLDGGTHTKDVTDDTTAGQTAGVTGTPTVFVNGVPLVGAQPYEALKTQIDQELAK